MKQRPIITFLSDFGTRDGYTGAVKGVIKSVNDKIEITDVTHVIESYNIKQAAFTILNYYNHFPKGTVHLAVVDPGVGSERGIIIMQTADYYFVGPDNGIFKYVMKNEDHKIYRVDPGLIYQNEKGSTFHARDIFAPVAAKLASGDEALKFGALTENFNFNKEPKYPFSNELISGVIEAITADKFGNIIFDYQKTDWLADKNHLITKIRFKNFESNQIYDYYSQVIKGNPLFLWNSLGFLELAICEGSAKDYFDYKSTDTATLIYK